MYKILTRLCTIDSREANIFAFVACSADGQKSTSYHPSHASSPKRGRQISPSVTTDNATGRAKELRDSQVDLASRLARPVPCRPSCQPIFGSSRPNGVYRSTDGGQTWFEIRGPWSAMAVTTGTIALAVAPSNPNTVYASIENPSLPGANGLTQGLLGLFRTDDAWASTPTWVQVPTQPTGPQGYCGRSCGDAHVIALGQRCS
jgi:hypothetical protein